MFRENDLCTTDGKILEKNAKEALMTNYSSVHFVGLKCSGNVILRQKKENWKHRRDWNTLFVIQLK